MYRSGKKEPPKIPEEIAEEEYQSIEQEVVVAREFVLATAGDKEKIKELSYTTLLKEIEEKN
ncbi:MAG: hypothetical protein ACOWWO_00095 [Peptococcaceae bacterium]